MRIVGPIAPFGPRVPNPLRRTLALAVAGIVVAALAASAGAQRLVVNGAEAGEVETRIVPGTAYASAASFATALGARFDVDPGANVLTFAFGGRLVRLVVLDDPDRANQPSPAITVDGRPVEGPAAVYVGVEPYVPVKALGTALGASVAFLAEEGAVAVVVPRAEVRGELHGRGDGERLVLRASSPTKVTSFYNAPVQTLQLRFERADIASAQAFEGSRLVRADVFPTRGAVDVRVQLAPDTSYALAELPDGDGFALVVTFAAARAAVDVGPVPSPPHRHRVVLDPSPTGDGAGLALATAQAMEATLARAGYEVALTRREGTDPGLADRSAAGIGAHLFLTIAPAELPRGSLRVYHLGDAATDAALDDAVRYNAETALRRPETDGVRRAVLLDLVADTDRGRAYAEGLVRELAGAFGYAVDGPRAAPLAVLAGAGGRGLLIEVGADDLRDPSFPDLLGRTLATVLGSGGL